MKIEQAQKVRVRFAPSPTGHLHIGSLRVALFNWLFAQRYGGVFLLRIEDTDLERSKEEYTQSILRSLEWCQLPADEPVVIQSERLHEHRRIIDQMIDEGKAYRCFCTADEVKARTITTEGQSVDYNKYDRWCFKKKITDADLKKPFAIRFKIPDEGVVEFNDLIRGFISFNIDQLDDFIIMRSDGTPMYNFVVVVDDAYMQISHVIRGEDHISNTPKQILLYRALGYSVPAFAHLPMILGPSGARLSKRDGATAVFDYKQEGFLPDALCNYLVRLGWAHGDQEIFTREEMIRLFSLEQVNKKSAIFDREKLLWVNSMYIRQASEEKLISAILEIDPTWRDQTADWDDIQRHVALTLYKQRVNRIDDLARDIVHVYKGPHAYEPADIAAWVTAETSSYLQHMLELLQHDHDWSTATLTAIVKSVAEEKKIKLVALAQPLRLAMIGKSAGPGVFELMSLLGKVVCLKRIEQFIIFLSSPSTK